MPNRASALLSRGESVVLDATRIDAGQRQAALQMTERTHADGATLHCQARDEVTTTRLIGRASGASDAGPGVTTVMTATEPPWWEAVKVDTSGPLGTAVIQALAAIRPHADCRALILRRSCTEPDRGLAENQAVVSRDSARWCGVLFFGPIWRGHAPYARHGLKRRGRRG
ncbi:AAA family ATPase [Streptomyces prasinus]